MFFCFSRRGVTFRRLLAEASHDYESLEKLWTEGKREAIEADVKKLETLTDEERTELTEILDSHFDPEKKPVKPVVQRRESTSEGNNMRSSNTNNGNRNGARSYRRRGNRGNQRGRSQGEQAINKENQGQPAVNKENQGPRSEGRRNRINSDKQNNVMDPKSGAIRKELKQQQVDSNQNNLVSAN